VVERARGFRPVLLGVVLFWVCVFAAFADECDSAVWQHPSNGYTSPSTANICAFYLTLGSFTSCVVDEVAGTATIDPIGETYGPEVWTRVGGPAACAAPEPEADPWTELDLMHAVVGVLWFFALIHGFSVGRVST